MKKTLRDRIDELAAMDVKALQAEHVKLFGQPAVSTHRQYLFRKIAWQVQAEEQGGLPEEVRGAARGIARDTPLRARVAANTAKRRAGLPEDQVATATIEPAHDARVPMPGGLIVKQYRGETHVVTVGEKGYQYGGSTFASLSAVAYEITGTKWNGYLFFALTQEQTHGRG
jgi:hypothetical protein